MLWSFIFPVQAQPRKLYVGIRSLASQGQPSWLWYITTYAWPLEKEMAAHSSILAGRILWMEEPGGLLSIGSHRVGHDWGDLACMHGHTKSKSSDQTTSAQPTDLNVSFSLYPYLWKTCSASLQVVLRDNCCVYSCSFSGSTKGSKLRIFSVHTLVQKQ